MEKKNVITLPWTKVTDWSGLSASHVESIFREKYCVCELDVDVFVENIYRDISRKLNIPYEQLEPVLVAENSAFYKLKVQLFTTCSAFERKNPQLIELQNSLRIPDISNVETSVTADNISSCLMLFENLSDIEKMIFLQKIGKINIKVQTE